MSRNSNLSGRDWEESRRERDMRRSRLDRQADEFDSDPFMIVFKCNICEEFLDTWMASEEDPDTCHLCVEKEDDNDKE